MATCRSSARGGVWRGVSAEASSYKRRGGGGNETAAGEGIRPEMAAAAAWRNHGEAAALP